MNLRIKRRRFGQLAIASAATTAIANLATKATAQSPLVIYGVSLSISNISSAVDAAIANLTPALTLTSWNISTGQQLLNAEVSSSSVENPLTDALPETQVPSTLQAQVDRITSFTADSDADSDGNFIVTSVAYARRERVSRLIFTESRSARLRRGLRVSGLQRNTTVESLLSTEEGNLLSILSLNRSVPPFGWGLIDRRTGRVRASDDLNLPDLVPIRRFSNLAQSPDGTTYFTSLGPEGGVVLVQLDLQQRSLITGKGRIIQLSRLSFNDQLLDNDVTSLAFSPSGQLFALADPNYEGTNSLFSVDVKSGDMTLVRQISARKIAFERT